MELDKDIFALSGKTAILYHKENDAVLICDIPTQLQIDGFEDFNELVVEVSEDEIQSWRIIDTLSVEDFLAIGKKLKKLRGG